MTFSADDAPAVDYEALWAGVNEHMRAARGYLGFQRCSAHATTKRSDIAGYREKFEDITLSTGPR